jgi:hypothetical protein
MSVGMSSDEVGYYRQRAIEERELALLSAQQHVAAIHLELARRCQALVDTAEWRRKFRIVDGNRQTD